MFSVVSVCLSVHREVPCRDHTWTCSNLFTWGHPPTLFAHIRTSPYRDLFKHVCKWAVGIQLKLLLFIFAQANWMRASSCWLVDNLVSSFNYNFVTELPGYNRIPEEDKWAVFVSKLTPGLYPTDKNLFMFCTPNADCRPYICNMYKLIHKTCKHTPWFAQHKNDKTEGVFYIGLCTVNM